MPDGGAVFLRSFAAAIRPRPPMTVSQWADRERYVSQRSSSAWGKWRTSRVPFAREIMDELSADSPAEEVVFVASVQVTKTEIGLNWIGYSAQEDPGPTLVVYPTVEVGGRWVRQRLNPMIAESPTLATLFPKERSRDATNTASMKEYPGGLIIIGGANSPASLSSMPAGKLMADEVDRYPRDVGKDSEGGGEGDPLDLAVARLSAFPRSKQYKASSPTILSLSRIWKDWLRSSQGEYHVPCPDCHELQVLRRENLRYPEGKPEEARFACIHCGVLIEERSKAWMLDEANGAKWIHKFPERIKVRGFHLSAWYSAPGLGKTWAFRAGQYEEVKNDPLRLKVFTNTVDGLCYEDKKEKLDWEALKARAEETNLREIPVGCLVLTAGVDVQANRLAVQIVGWGREQAAWVIDWLEIPGDPTQSKVWQDLDAYLQKPLVNRWGLSMRPSAVAVDAGYLQDHVLGYTRPRNQRNVIAVKGVDAAGRTILTTATKPDKNRHGRTSKTSVDLWIVSSSAAKEVIFLHAQADAERLPGERLIRFAGGRRGPNGEPGVGLDEEYYTQFTAEIFDPHKRKWVKQQARNEALDTFVYALAASHHPNVRVQVYKDQDWALLESVYQPKGDLFNPVPPDVGAAPVVAAAPAPPPAARRRVRSDGVKH